MIVTKNLCKDYSGRDILIDVDIKINEGRKIGLVGKNGCGKSTLFRLLNGIETPTSGNIEIQN